MAHVSDADVMGGFAKRKALKIATTREEIAQKRSLIQESNQFLLDGMASMQEGDYQRAIDAYNEALLRCKQLGQRQTIAQVVKVLTLTYQQLGDAETIRASYDKSREFFRRFGFKDDEARILELRAAYEMRQGENSKSHNCFMEALSIYRKIKDENGQAGLYTAWAKAYMDMGRYAEAKASLKKASEIYQKGGDIDEEGYKSYRAARETLKAALSEG